MRPTNGAPSSSDGTRRSGDGGVDVLVVGAGPTGLILALWLARLGVRARIIDRASEPGTTSRALAVHARTLELYDQVGLADDVVRSGRTLKAVNLWVAGAKAARIAFGDIGRGLSPHPYMLIFPQDEHERLLIARLDEAGIRVERKTELVSFERFGRGVRARLKSEGGVHEICEASYLVGCDGARSTVREVIGAEFPGGTYAELFYVADVEASGRAIDGELHVCLDEADFLAVFPLKPDANVRLIGTVRDEAQRAEAVLGWRDVSERATEQMRLDVDRVNWFSTYRVHHRVAVRFRDGAVFLAGDAAHIHSPVGGQGMNTGIGDAVNLAWKLAAVLHGRAQERLLATYEPERMAFARRLVETTDRVFSFVTARGPIARGVRLEIVPRVLPRIFGGEAGRRFMFRTISQIGITYRESPLASGKAGRVRGGDRMPWLPGVAVFAPLHSLDWQIHVHGDPRPALVRACAARGIPLHVFPWTNDARRAGLARDAAYLVRPDGHVAFADPRADAQRLTRFLDAWSIRPAHELPRAA